VILLVALFLWAPHSRASELRQFDVLVIPHRAFAAPVPEINRARVHATFGEIYRRQVSVIGVEPAQPILGKHTVVLLDFEHSSARLRSSMIMESRRALAEAGNSDITLIAVGEPGKDVQILDLADNTKMGFCCRSRRMNTMTRSAERIFPDVLADLAGSGFDRYRRRLV